jgi:hypothetical protein
VGTGEIAGDEAMAGFDRASAGDEVALGQPGVCGPLEWPLRHRV